MHQLLLRLNPLKSGSYPESYNYSSWKSHRNSLNPLKSGSYIHCLNPLKSGSYPENQMGNRLMFQILLSQSPKKRVLSRGNNSLIVTATSCLNPLKSGSYPEYRQKCANRILWSQSPKKRVLSREWNLEGDDLGNLSLNPLKSGSYPEKTRMGELQEILVCLNPLKSGSYPEEKFFVGEQETSLSQSPKKRVLSRVASR